MKRRIFLVCLTVFFRLPIYESIAAIFWQSASYVLHRFNCACSVLTDKLRFSFQDITDGKLVGQFY